MLCWGWGWVGDLGSWCQVSTGQAISGEFTSSVIAWTFPCLKEERRCQGLAFTRQLIPRETCPRQEGIGPELPHPTARRAAPSLRPQLACSHLPGSCFERQSQMVRNKMVNESVLLQEARPDMIQSLGLTGPGGCRWGARISSTVPLCFPWVPNASGDQDTWGSAPQPPDDGKKPHQAMPIQA